MYDISLQNNTLRPHGKSLSKEFKQIHKVSILTKGELENLEQNEIFERIKKFMTDQLTSVVKNIVPLLDNEFD